MAGEHKTARVPARKLITWLWRVIVEDDDCVEQGLAHCERHVRKTKERALKRLAKEWGQQITPLSSIRPIAHTFASNKITDLPLWFTESVRAYFAQMLLRNPWPWQ